MESQSGRTRRYEILTDLSWSTSSCSICGRNASPAIEIVAVTDTVSLCLNCKFSVLEGQSGQSLLHHRLPTRRRIRTRHNSSESVDDLFSHQFTHMINRARQSLSPAPGNDNWPGDVDASSRSFHHTSARTNSTGSRRWRRGFSDTESEDTDLIDSHFGESDSNASFHRYRLFYADSDAVSFSAYGGDSDVSVDGHSILDAEIHVRADDGSDLDDDTDIDPMHAAVNQWDSDGQDDEDDGEWEEAEVDEETVWVQTTRADDRYSLTSPSESSSSINQSQLFDSPDFDELVQQRVRESWRVVPRNLFYGFGASNFPLHHGNPGDYLDARGFEELLEHLAETDNSRRGAPPTAVSFMKNIPSLTINEKHEKCSLMCAICKDNFLIGTEVKQLPCLHLYHPSCIFPWLSTRNSCPLCRYELPTDDTDYEESKRSFGEGILVHEEDRTDYNDANASSVYRRDETSVIDIPRGEALPLGDNPSTNSTRRESRRGRWLFLAAAPLVGLVGIVLAVWIGNPDRQGLSSSHNMHQIDNHRGGRGRRWWPFL